MLNQFCPKGWNVRRLWRRGDFGVQKRKKMVLGSIKLQPLHSSLHLDGCPKIHLCKSASKHEEVQRTTFVQLIFEMVMSRPAIQPICWPELTCGCLVSNENRFLCRNYLKVIWKWSCNESQNNVRTFPAKYRMFRNTFLNHAKSLWAWFCKAPKMYPARIENTPASHGKCPKRSPNVHRTITELSQIYFNTSARLTQNHIRII